MASASRFRARRTGDAVGHARRDRPARLRAEPARGPRHAACASYRALIDAIGMRAHGPLALERFGDGELEGWSAMQFIETSSITIHADEVSGRCFVDVFSCRPFDPDVAAAVAVAHFGGTPHRDACCTDEPSWRPSSASSPASSGIADTVPYVRDTVRRRATRPAPRDVADLGRPGDRGVPLAAGRRRLVEPDHGRRRRPC